MSKRKPKPKRSRTKAMKPKATKKVVKKVAKKKGGAAPARRARRGGRKRTTATRRGREGAEEQGRTVGLLREVLEHHETGPAASAGDLDADWQRAQSSGEEAAGGSVSTPDQDRVDDIGHALGVEQPSTAPLRSSEEMLEERDRRYWELERRAQ
ncbi:MAG TPA: DUF6335 family protein, partial [Methylomirabilota bacterium]|nr:DUF6335 family protein [Methylomirabilota bacterium]